MHPRLECVDLVGECLDGAIDIVSSPVANGFESPWVRLEKFEVGKRLLWNGIGVEIVVHDECVDVVACDEVGDHVEEVETNGVDGGVEIEFAAVFKEPIGVFEIGVKRVERSGLVGHGGAIGVDPDVCFHASLVREGDEAVKWVVGQGVGCDTLLAAEVC